MGSCYHVPDNSGSNGIQVFLGGNNTLWHPISSPLAMGRFAHQQAPRKTHLPSKQPSHDPLQAPPSPSPSPSPSPPPQQTTRPDLISRMDDLENKFNLLLDATGLSDAREGSLGGHSLSLGRHTRRINQAEGRQAGGIQVMESQAEQGNQAASAIHVPGPIPAEDEGLAAAAVPGTISPRMTVPGGCQTGSRATTADSIQTIAPAPISNSPAASRSNSHHRSKLSSVHSHNPFQGTPDESAARIRPLSPHPGRQREARNQNHQKITSPILVAEPIEYPDLPPPSFSQPDEPSTSRLEEIAAFWSVDGG